MINLPISLDIPDVEILKVEKNKTEDLIITVKSTKDFCTCRKCGNEARKINGYAEAILLRHLSVLGHQMYIRIKLVRYQCEHCVDRTTTTEQASWYNRRS
jgi:transposase